MTAAQNNNNSPFLTDTEALTKYAREKLDAELLLQHPGDEKKTLREEFAKTVIDLLKENLTQFYSNKNAKGLPLDKDKIANLAIKTYEAAKNAKGRNITWDGKVTVDSDFSTLEKASVLTAIKLVAAETLEKKAEESSQTAIQLGNKLGDNNSAARPKNAADQFAEESQEKADDAKLDEMLVTQKKVLESLNKHNTEAKAILDAVSESRIQEIKTGISDLGEKIAASVKNRSDYMLELEAYNAQEKKDQTVDGKKALDDKAAALKAEEEALATTYNTLITDKFKSGKEPDAVKYILRNQISDELHGLYSADIQQVDAAIARAAKGNHLSKASELIGQNALEHTGGVPKRSPTGNNGEKASTQARVVRGVAAAAAATAVIAAINSANKEVEVTNEKGETTTKKKGMSFFGKVAVAVGIVLTVGLAVSAVNGGKFQGDTWAEKVKSGIGIGPRGYSR